MCVCLSVYMYVYIVSEDEEYEDERGYKNKKYDIDEMGVGVRKITTTVLRHKNPQIRFQPFWNLLTF